MKNETFIEILYEVEAIETYRLAEHRKNEKYHTLACLSFTLSLAFIFLSANTGLFNYKFIFLFLSIILTVFFTKKYFDNLERIAETVRQADIKLTQKVFDNPNITLEEKRELTNKLFLKYFEF